MANQRTPDNFLRHVQLIEQQDNLTTESARFRAWTEGPEALEEREARQARIDRGEEE